jgi:hypothetical protein
MIRESTRGFVVLMLTYLEFISLEELSAKRSATEPADGGPI